MDSLRLQAVAARVVAWHNRHPLARRITAAQVHAIGYVALPFAAPASAPASTPPAFALRAAFSADFLAPLKPRHIARWALLHGRVLAQPPADAPLREVPADAAQVGANVQVYVLTAAIELGPQRTRVLLGAGEPAAVLGPRLWSPGRAAAAGAGMALLLLLAGAGLRLAGGVRSESVAPVLAAASAPGMARSVSAALAVQAAASAAPAAASSADLRALISDADKAAARQARAALLGARAELSSAGQPAASAPLPTPALRSGAPAFALLTKALRTRAEAEQLSAAMGGLLRKSGVDELRTEILPEGDDWRVVGWPFPRRSEAEKARELLVARGMRVRVIDF